jgi:hypothetical protein
MYSLACNWLKHDTSSPAIPKHLTKKHLNQISDLNASHIELEGEGLLRPLLDGKENPMRPLTRGICHNQRRRRHSSSLSSPPPTSKQQQATSKDFLQVGAISLANQSLHPRLFCSFSSCAESSSYWATGRWKVHQSVFARGGSPPRDEEWKRAK